MLWRRQVNAMAAKAFVMLADCSPVIAGRMESVIVVPLLRLIGTEGDIDRLSDVCILARNSTVQAILCKRQGVLELLVSTVWQAVSLVRLRASVGVLSRRCSPGRPPGRLLV